MDSEARREFEQQHFNGVPSFIVGKDTVEGFNPGKLLQLIDHRVIKCGQCQTNLRVPIDRGSIKVTCPKCKNVFDWQPPK